MSSGAPLCPLRGDPGDPGVPGPLGAVGCPYSIDSIFGPRTKLYLFSEFGLLSNMHPLCRDRACSLLGGMVCKLL